MCEREVTAKQAIVMVEARELLRSHDVPVDVMSDEDVLAHVSELAQELIPAMRKLLALLEMIIQQQRAAENENGFSLN